MTNKQSLAEKAHQHVFEAGFKAFTKGKRMSRNPYAHANTAHGLYMKKTWRKGWKTAELAIATSDPETVPVFRWQATEQELLESRSL